MAGIKRATETQPQGNNACISPMLSLISSPSSRFSTSHFPILVDLSGNPEIIISVLCQGSSSASVWRVCSGRCAGSISFCDCCVWDGMLEHSAECFCGLHVLTGPASDWDSLSVNSNMSLVGIYNHDDSGSHVCTERAACIGRETSIACMNVDFDALDWGYGDMVPTTTLGERMGICKIPWNGKLLQPFFHPIFIDGFSNMLRLSPLEAKLWVSCASTAAFLVNVNTYYIVDIACLRTPESLTRGFNMFWRVSTNKSIYRNSRHSIRNVEWLFNSLRHNMSHQSEHMFVLCFCNVGGRWGEYEEGWAKHLHAFGVRHHKADQPFEAEVILLALPIGVLSHSTQCMWTVQAIGCKRMQKVYPAMWGMSTNLLFSQGW